MKDNYWKTTVRHCLHELWWIMLSNVAYSMNMERKLETMIHWYFKFRLLNKNIRRQELFLHIEQMLENTLHYEHRKPIKTHHMTVSTDIWKVQRIFKNRDVHSWQKTVFEWNYFFEKAKTHTNIFSKLLSEKLQIMLDFIFEWNEYTSGSFLTTFFSFIFIFIWKLCCFLSSNTISVILHLTLSVEWASPLRMLWVFEKHFLNFKTPLNL